MIEFWYDFASTYSYPAAMRIEKECAQAGVALAFRPFLLGPVFHELLGIKDSPFNVQPVAGTESFHVPPHVSAADGLPWKKPSIFPRHSVLAARVALAAGDRIAEVTRALFHANFAEDRDISDPVVVRDIVGSAELVERAQTPEVKARLRETTDEARRLGIFGAPDFVVSGELFFGQDRLQDAIAWARTATP